MKLTNYQLFWLTQPTSNAINGSKMSETRYGLVLKFLEALLQPTKIQKAYFIRSS